MNRDIKAIRALERAYSIRLWQRDIVLGDENGYSLDAEGRVEALALIDCEIDSA